MVEAAPIPGDHPGKETPLAQIALAPPALLYRRLFFSLVAGLDAERTHELVLGLLARASRSPALCRVLGAAFAYDDPALAVERLGLRFRGPLGLAGGFDKNGVALGALAALGFSHVEVGTITPRPQPGNPRPRVFRLPADDALINAMGFPSAGAARVRANLARARHVGLPVGVNVGKNKDTPIDRAWDDYVRALEILYPYGDYFVANISSPNTVGLRDLHHEALLVELGQAMAERARALAPAGSVPKPLLLKLSPDLTPTQLDGTVAAARAGGWSGLVLGNTTVGRDGLRDPNRDAPGGVSGRPILPRTVELVRELRRAIPPDWLLVGVGGVFDADDAWQLLRAGADLVQAYTGFVYGGPAFAGRVSRGLAALLARHGYRSLREVLSAEC
jgi:dihydroorotate dehydrogenase